MKYILIISLLLASCISIKTTDDTNSILDKKKYLSSLDNWTINGRLLIKNSNLNIGSSFSWEKLGDDINLYMFGPFGINSIKLSISNEGIYLHDDNRITRIDNNNLQTQEAFFWAKVYESFNFWLIGLEDPNYPSKIITAEDGYISKLNQRSWAVNYESYQLTGKVLIPKEINLTNDNYEIKLRIDSFRP